MGGTGISVAADAPDRGRKVDGGVGGFVGGFGNAHDSLGLNGRTEIGLNCGTLSGCIGGNERYCAPLLSRELPCELSLPIENTEEFRLGGRMIAV